MKSVASDLFYLPNLEFFVSILDADQILLNPNAPYQRKSYFNRTQILLSNKVETLSVPITGRRPRVPLKYIQIDYQQKWLQNHLRGLQSAYGKAPFFEFFFPEIEAIYKQEFPSLWEFNLKLLTICLKFLQLPVKLEVVEDWEGKKPEKDFRGIISPSEPFEDRGIYEPFAYTQLFGLDFEPNLSILDLLFCEGPTAKRVLMKSLKKQ
ncbi:WbqC family protein [Algoriphagus sp. PAP.12]|uniref:WbqC family protein n=1 Tax=Algoriphagus sp. PAP.12 TaxID=2996678 RepID=UPI00227C753E|nr:WbqC family protein [Algoriphagus sp. PAP.12]